jgi:deazaflavin-dependent oxidoreductase (nitroreductase family)
VPAIKVGLGPLHSNPLTGPQLLLRTVGRRSGRVREVALGYAIVGGNVYVSAGFGTRTAWLHNLRAEPQVELVLPGAAIAGIAEEVRDPIEADRAWRALIRALGLLGRGFVGPADLPPAQLAARTAGLPLVRIRPTGLGNGPADPGGYGWVSMVALAAGWWLLRRRTRDRDRRAQIG